MSDAPQSPRRRHILASINPDHPRKRDRDPDDDERRERRRDRNRTRDRNDEPVKDSEAAAPELPEDSLGDDVEKTQSRPSRLKLKDHRSRRRHRRSSRSRSRSRSRDRNRERHRSDGSHRSHRRHHRRRHRSPTPPNPHEEETLDPEAAFRASLFDAMIDDEGAAYWEGVYGQPVHVYSNEKVGPAGELEQMDDEEYAAYVRQKMWEKTHAGILEERARREEAKKRKEEEDRHNKKLQNEMERSLRRGEERRQRRMWASRWDEYIRAWSAWDGSPTTINWPVESGRREDIEQQRVRDFFINGLDLGEAGEKSFAAGLKDERVRWHPDKIQQRLGGRVDDEIMKDVTAIFQIIDRLWGDARAK